MYHFQYNGIPAINLAREEGPAGNHFYIFVLIKKSEN